MPSEAHQQIVEFLRATASGASGAPSFEAARAALDQMGQSFSVPEGVDVSAVEIAGVPCESIAPVVGEHGTLVYLHGGAYTVGSLNSHRSLSSRIALATGCRVIAVDYRLAPEYPFPAGLDDCATVVAELLDRGLDPSELFVGGDSAGGGMAMALMLRRLDDGLVLPAGAVLLSPWLDLHLQSASITERAAADPLLNVASLARSVEAFVDDPSHPHASPILADPTGLPALLILVGTAEILLDDSLVFAEAATAAGVDVEIDVEDGLIHVWPFLDGIPEAAAAMERIGSWVKARLTPVTN